MTLYDRFRTIMHKHGWHWWVWSTMTTWCESGNERIILLRSEAIRFCRLCDVSPQIVDVEYRPLPRDWLPDDVELKPYY